MDKKKGDVLIEFRNVNKSFLKGEVKVLENFSYSFLRGETHIICGRSGAGKSTLIRCINGLESIDNGEILLDGEPITEKNLQDVRKRVAMVFQDFNLFPHLSVLDNVTFGPVHSLHVPKEEAEKRGIEYLERVGLGNKIKSKPYELSGGQKQRVAIARALNMERSRV